MGTDVPEGIEDPWLVSITHINYSFCAVCCTGTGVGTEVLEGFTTRIWMQLRPDLDSQRLTQELRLLDPYMLLNLRKLKYVGSLVAFFAGFVGFLSGAGWWWCLAGQTQQLKLLGLYMLLNLCKLK